MLESHAGGGLHDTHQVSDRPDPRRLRDSDRRRLVRNTVGRSKARLPAGTRYALCHDRRRSDLPALVAVRLVVSLRRLRARHLLTRWRDSRNQRLPRLRRGSHGLSLARAAASHRTTYGSAHWASPRDTRAAGLFSDAGVFLGQASRPRSGRSSASSAASASPVSARA